MKDGNPNNNVPDNTMYEDLLYGVIKGANRSKGKNHTVSSVSSTTLMIFCLEEAELPSGPYCLISV